MELWAFNSVFAICLKIAAASGFTPWKRYVLFRALQLIVFAAFGAVGWPLASCMFGNLVYNYGSFVSLT